MVRVVGLERLCAGSPRGLSRPAWAQNTTTPVNGTLVNAPSVIYPFATVPARGAAVEVAPGVLWLRMPLPIALDHINVWALEDGESWTIVDTGMHTALAVEVWQQIFAGPLGNRPVGRVICTHMHPDHVGMAGWLTRRFECRLWMSRLEYVICRMLVADAHREAPADGVRFYRAAGWDEAAIEAYRAGFGGFGRHIHELPDSFHRLSDGDEIVIGGRRWLAVVGRGHSPEHVCLYCPELEVMIAGDQVLPKITSNVSVFPTEPDADPLAEWLNSIAAIGQRVPDTVLVLPAHKEPFRGLHARLGELNAWHEGALRRVLAALREPKRAIDVFPAMFRRNVSHALQLATGECIAHLNCLRGRGLIECEQVDGIAWYRASRSPAALEAPQGAS